jgi:hypothetical protein
VQHGSFITAGEEDPFACGIIVDEKAACGQGGIGGEVNMEGSRTQKTGKLLYSKGIGDGRAICRDGDICLCPEGQSNGQNGTKQEGRFYHNTVWVQVNPGWMEKQDEFDLFFILFDITASIPDENLKIRDIL